MSSSSEVPPLAELITARLNRREALRGLTALAALGSLSLVRCGREAGVTEQPATLTFDEVAHGNDQTHAVAKGYRAQTLIRWGDPVENGAPVFDPLRQTAQAQAKQWGYNNDFVAWMPLPAGSASAGRGLLCVNFEYTEAHLMFPGLQPGEAAKVTKEQVDTELAAHGHGVIEIRRDEVTGAWFVVEGSLYNRRITALASACLLSGPAAGDARLKTRSDPTGTKVIGTLGNCAGGKTPWGTILIAEENFHSYFAGDPEITSETRNLKRYGFRLKSGYAWSRYYERFDVEKDPHEANKFGWVVEYDPYHPTSVPVKRTALGRFAHEGATTAASHDGRVVVYSGDDDRFEYLYRFVTRGRFYPKNPDANRDLLDDGTLSVAKFHDNGRLTWMPLIYGQGPLTKEHGFASQADVLIETRRAADLLGATPMDRPEDVETNPRTGLVYVALTYNDRRGPEQVSAVHPRGPNPHGHIVELAPPNEGGDRDHTAPEYRWDVFLLAGDPANSQEAAHYHPQVSENGWLSAPDNVAFDRKGRIWIATDGLPRFGLADGAYVAETEGPYRALTRHFYRAPLGAELCGPEFNGDDTAFFVAVQHPGDSKGATFDHPASRWPDFQAGMPPRPAVQVIVKEDGGAIGS